MHMQLVSGAGRIFFLSSCTVAVFHPGGIINFFDLQFSRAWFVMSTLFF